MASIANPNVPEVRDDLLVIARRYSGVTADALKAVLCPVLTPIRSLDKTITKLAGQTHYRASFTIEINDENRVAITRGRTGKFVPSTCAAGGLWREIAKGRIIEADLNSGVTSGEVYVSGGRSDLDAAIVGLEATDLLEIDQFGASAKVLSALAEYYLVEIAQQAGYVVHRMPEDMAKHLGAYANYDFDFCKAGVTKKIEVKSLWGTDTAYARLIHSTTTKPKGDSATWTTEEKKNYYPTSSCRFTTQDIFAVSLFLRTGNIQDFAFARSVPRDVKPYGLPRAQAYPEHLNQNPTCTVGDGTWFASIDEVWNLE